MKERTAVILCGGRGKRLGRIGDELPKALVPVLGKPILWYSFLRLYLEGFRHFVLPLGYRGHLIQGFIDNALTEFDIRIDSIPTGDDTEIGMRLQRVRHLLPDDGFLLLNGDTLFDFPVAAAADAHEASDKMITMTSCSVISQYGLLVIDGESVSRFSRDSLIHSFQVTNRPGGRLRRAQVYSGISFIRSAALDHVDLATTRNFEGDLFSVLIGKGQARHHSIDGYWFAIDTPKDVEIANAGDGADPRSSGARALRDMLANAEAELFPTKR